MKKLYLILVLMFGVYGVNAQTVDPTPTPEPVNCVVTPQHAKCQPVTVTAGFVDEATKAFNLVVAQRDAINQFLNERRVTAAERQAWEQVKKSLEEVIAVYAKKDEAYQSLIKVYDQMIKIQGEIIERLEKQLNKKKGFFDKVLDALKTATYILAGAAIGAVVR